MSRCYICDYCDTMDSYKSPMKITADGYDICGDCIQVGIEALEEFGYEDEAEVPLQDADSCGFKGGTAAEPGGTLMYPTQELEEASTESCEEDLE